MQPLPSAACLQQKKTMFINSQKNDMQIHNTEKSNNVHYKPSIIIK